MSARRLSWNAIAAASYVVGSALMLFELYRYLARELGPAQIGVWSLVTASSAVVRISEFGISAGVVRYVAADLGQGRADRAAATAGMALAISGFTMGLVGVALYPLLGMVVTQVISDPAAAAAGRSLLPWAIAALWLVAQTNVFVGVLDGQQRAGLRATALLASNAIQILLAWTLVPRYGLQAMGPVQFGFALSGFLLLGWLAVLTLGQPLRQWGRWQRRRLGELFRFGGAFQVMSLLQVLFEPTSKWLLSVFGGLEATGYFEMANRAVQQLRQVMVAALLMLIPHVASQQARARSAVDAAGAVDAASAVDAAGAVGVSASGPSRTTEALSEIEAAGGVAATTTPSLAPASAIYRQSMQTLLWSAVPYLCVIGCLLPALLTFWVGHYSGDFITIGVICLLGWGTNLLAAPAYAVFVGLAKLRWVVASQVLVSVLNVALSTCGGYAFGAYGVVAGAMLSLALGSAVMPAAFQRQNGIGVAGLIPQTLPWSGTVALVAVCLCLWLGQALQYGWALALVWPYTVAVLTSAATLVILMWRDPLRKQLLARLSRTTAATGTALP